MSARIQIELLKLPNGDRMLRFEHSSSDLSLEKRLDVNTPVAMQKERWLRSFTALLSRELTPVQRLRDSPTVCSILALP